MHFAAILVELIDMQGVIAYSLHVARPFACVQSLNLTQFSTIYTGNDHVLVIHGLKSIKTLNNAENII